MTEFLILMAVEMQMVYKKSSNWYLVNRVTKKGELVLILRHWGVTQQMLITFLCFNYYIITESSMWETMLLL